MSKIFRPSFLKKIAKSKTMILQLLIATLGIVEYNLHLFYNTLGDNYALVYMLIAIAGVWIRMLTTTSLEDKE
jgi:hypothetical protein